MSSHAAPHRHRAPGPRGWPLIGNLPEMRRDVLGLMLRGMHDYGDVVRYRIGPWTVHLICHPDDILHVFQKTASYDKQTFASARIRSVTGNGLLVSNGQEWRTQRIAVQAGFTQARVDSYLGMIVERTQRMLDRWESICDTGQGIDIASEMMRLTYGIIEQALFSTETGEELGEIEEAVTVAMMDAYRRIEHPFSLPAAIPTPANLRLKHAIRTIHRKVDEIIREHRQIGRYQDLLSDMMDGTAADGSQDTVKSQAITLLLAGHETTANSLTWLWHLLDQHPDAAEKMHKEACATGNSSSITKDSLKSLTWTNLVLQETMRLYTPIWAIFRRVVHSDEIGGYEIPKDSLAIISPYVTHRHPQFWTNPDQFDPSRFEPDRVGTMHSGAYIPFGGGERFCVGRNLARLEALVIATMISGRFRLRTVPGHSVQMDPGITLRCRNGLKMTVESFRSPASDHRESTL